LRYYNYYITKPGYGVCRVFVYASGADVRIRQLSEKRRPGGFRRAMGDRAKGYGKFIGFNVSYREILNPPRGGKMIRTGS
jgi:hypothetical protein